jgi:threonine dehydrogenase-like Zn-dependent dehydrogenase
MGVEDTRRYVAIVWGAGPVGLFFAALLGGAAQKAVVERPVDQPLKGLQ